MATSERPVNKVKFTLLWQILMASLLLAFSQANYADEEQDRRVRSGLKLFRAILSADRDITAKENTKQELDIVFVYQSDIPRAEGFARSFVRMGRRDKKGKIKDRPLKVHILQDINTIDELSLKPAGIFIVDTLPNQKIQETANFGKQHGLVTYSPFEGDVEKGILSGLSVETRVRPYINVATMNASNLRIKPFFMKVAKTYEP